jgi:hypothetical protein
MKQRWPLRRCVEVEWVDSCTDGRWASVAIHRKESHPSTCRTIGYIVDNSPKHIILAQSQSIDTQHCTDTMAIPKSAVRRVKRVNAWR